MSHEGEEDLLEYSDNEQEIQVDANNTAESGEVSTAVVTIGEEQSSGTNEDDKKCT